MQVEQVAETSFFKKTFLIGKNSIHYWTVLQQRVFSGLQCAFGKLSTHQGPNGREKPQSKRGIWARRWIHMRLLEARWADGAVDILLWELRKLTTILTGLEVLIPTAQRRAIDLLLGIDLLLLKEAVWKLLVVFWLFVSHRGVSPVSDFTVRKAFTLIFTCKLQSSSRKLWFMLQFWEFLGLILFSPILFSIYCPCPHPDSSVGKEFTCNAGDPGSIPGSGRSTGERRDYPLPYSWAYLVSQLVKNLPAMKETWVRFLGWEDPLKKEKATHSSILAWRIPLTI